MPSTLPVNRWEKDHSRKGLRGLDSEKPYWTRHAGVMKPLLIVLALIALVLLIIGVAVETLKFLLYVGLVVLVASAALLLLQRVRSRAQR